MNLLTLLVVVPPVTFALWITFWHIWLVVWHPTAERPGSISGHAERRKRILAIHRLSHSLPLIILIPFVVGFLIPQHLITLAILLVVAALFDVIEVFTLRHPAVTDSIFGSDGRLHEVFAWLMALTYFLYTSVLLKLVGYFWWFGVLLFVAMILGYMYFFFRKDSIKHKFLVMQLIFFSSVAVAMFAGHVLLLVQRASFL